MKNTKVIVSIILVLVGLGAGFGGGYFFRNYQLTKSRGNFGAIGTNGQRFMGGRTGQGAVAGARGGAVTGSILSMDANLITVKLADGSSKIVLFSTSTTYSNTVNAAQSDLKVGQNVAVVGATNSDGSVTATNVQINPEFGRSQPSPTPAAK
jgi:hypothetical protein